MVSAASSSDPAFRGTARYRLLERLGRGGSGTVYRAFDSELRREVALKVLRRRQGDPLFRFKREYRALASLSHPNLVERYALEEAKGTWFCSMELVQGVDFVTWCRGDPTEAITLQPSEDGRIPEPAGPDYERIGAALEQLVAAVAALHTAGHLHRDIKPSNVLVEPDGRVVVLDFGLVSDPAVGIFETVQRVGTPAYMAPEQATDTPASEASDWYAVGTMLFEVLTGRRPFMGEPMLALAAKQARDAPDPLTLVPGLDPGWAAAVRALLERDPEQRPTGKALLQRLQLTRAQPASRPLHLHRPDSLVGRGVEVAELKHALDQAIVGAGNAILVVGRSGIGKTTLIEHFLAEAHRENPELMILAGRCYEHEEIRYKGLDALIDSLGRHLAIGWPADEVAAVLPEGIAHLARVFPTLARVPAIRAALGRAPNALPDPREERRRAFEAFGDLIANLSTRCPLVLFVDDLQWIDEDSLNPVAGVLRRIAALRVLIIAAWRVDASRTLSAPLVERLSGLEATFDVGRIALGPLSAEASRELAETWYRTYDHRHASEETVEQAVITSQGHPALLREIARIGDDGGSDLGALIRRRAAGLTDTARRVVTAVAIAGHPISAEVAAATAAAPHGGRLALAELEEQQFVTLVRTPRGPALTCSHDSIRGAFVSELTPDAQAVLHAHLAAALMAAQGDDAHVVRHLAASRQHQAAARLARRAADMAEEALAYNRAVHLRQLVLELQSDQMDATERATACEQLADSLAMAGRLRAATKMYLESAGLSEGLEGIARRARAAECALTGGRPREGRDLLKQALAELGVTLPSKDAATVFSIGWRKAALWVGGALPRRTRQRQLTGMERVKADLHWAGAIGLLLVEPLGAIDHHARYQQLARQSGDPAALAASLGLGSLASVALAGWRGRHRRQRLVRKAIELATAANDPVATARVALFQGMGCLPIGEFAQCLELCTDAERLLRAHAPNRTWELDAAQIFAAFTAGTMGDVTNAAALVERGLADGSARGDRVALAFYRMNAATLVDLPRDRIDEARHYYRQLLADPELDAYRLAPLWRLKAEILLRLHEGDGPGAWEAAERRFPEASAGGLLRSAYIRIESAALQGRAALGVLTSRDHPAAAAALRRVTRQLRGSQAPWGRAMGLYLEAGQLALGGDPERAVARLQLAESDLAACGLRSHAAAARATRGLLIGGASGELLLRQAQTDVTALGIKQPLDVWRQAMLPLG